MTLTEESPVENSALARQLAQAQAAAMGVSFETAWNSIRHARPDLFGLESRQVVETRNRREADARAERTILQNRSLASLPGNAAMGVTLTATQRYHGAEAYQEMEGPRLVNREDAEPFEIMEAVRDFQREKNLPSFSAAWDRAKVEHPEWFYATA